MEDADFELLLERGMVEFCASKLEMSGCVFENYQAILVIHFKRNETLNGRLILQLLRAGAILQFF